MNTDALSFAVIGFVVVFVTLILYFRTIPRGTVPVEIGGFFSKLFLRVGLSGGGVFFLEIGAGAPEPPFFTPARPGGLFCGVFLLGF